jgi:hypothetical protein
MFLVQRKGVGYTMSRLVAFGCSLTYGQGLEDCVDKYDVTIPGPTPSQMGWVSIVANELKLDIVNQGNPGASNLEVLNQLLQFELKEDDTVVLMWTYSFRDTYFYRKLFGRYAFRQLKRWINPIGHILWSPSGNEVDFVIKTWLYMHHADLYLKNKNVKYIHYPVCPDDILEHKPTYVTIRNLYLDGFTIIDRALDNHPGIKSNKDTANKILRILNSEK